MIFAVYTNTFKRIAHNPVNWVFILLFPIIFALLITVSRLGEDDGALISNIPLGVVDKDNTALSRTLKEQLETRFRVLTVDEKDIFAVLTEQDALWVLVIPDGYGADIVNRVTPQLKSYMLNVSDVSELAALNAENITLSLMALGTDDQTVLAEWAETSKVVTETERGYDGWDSVTYWLGFFGFVVMITSYFVAKALTDDKRGGMSDRIGVLPHSPRKYLISGALAAFTATEITVALTLAVVLAFYGGVENMPLLFLILSLFNLFSVSFLLAVVSVSRDLGAISVITMLSATAFSMLGGAFWPIELVPDYMQKLARISPMYWLLRGIGDIKDITFSGFGMSVLFLLGFTAVAVFFGGRVSVRKMDD